MPELLSEALGSCLSMQQTLHLADLIWLCVTSAYTCYEDIKQIPKSPSPDVPYAGAFELSELPLSITVVVADSYWLIML